MQNLKMIVAAAVLIVLLGASAHRNTKWHSLLAMWQDCAAKSPKKSRTHNNLGNCFVLDGKVFSAMIEYQKAVDLEPGNIEAQYNLAQSLDTVGLYTQALSHYDLFCRYAPPTFPEQRARACARRQEIEAGNFRPEQLGSVP
jgi:tetratricopeptide (TPR) repeat protein